MKFQESEETSACRPVFIERQPDFLPIQSLVEREAVQTRTFCCLSFLFFLPSPAALIIYTQVLHFKELNALKFVLCHDFAKSAQ